MSTPKPTLHYLSPKPGAADWVKRSAVTLGCYPPLLLACVYGAWLGAWVVLGRRPVPSFDDPDSIHPAVTGLAWVSIVGLIAAVPAWLAYTVLVGVLYVRRATPYRRLTLTAYLALGVLPWTPVLFVIDQDPGHVLEWLVD